MSSSADGALQAWRASTASSGYLVRQSEEAMKLLRKENFNLKLKLFLIECKQGESVLKQKIDDLGDQEFIDLFMDNQTMKNELSEKQCLLKDALKVIESLEEENSKYKLRVQALLAAQQAQIFKVTKSVNN